MMDHLTFSGKVSVVYYAVRRRFVRPAPDPYERCIMGYPIGEEVRCPRRSLPGELWCSRHKPKATR